MGVVVSLYRRFEHLVRELTKFGSIGAAAFVITVAGGNLLHIGLRAGPLTSNAIATLLATTFAYFANRFWTFRHRDRTGLGREYVLFFGLNGVGLVITQLFIGFTSYVIMQKGAIAYNVSLIIGTAVATLFRFWSYKKWVFLPSSAPVIDPATGLPEADGAAAEGGTASNGPAGDGKAGDGAREHDTHRRGIIEAKPVTDGRSAEFSAAGTGSAIASAPITGSVPAGVRGARR